MKKVISNGYLLSYTVMKKHIRKICESQIIILPLQQKRRVYGNSIRERLSA